jgi:polyphosphate kinase
VNKSLNFIVSLQGKDAFGRSIEMAIVPAPRSLPRLIQMPKNVAGNIDTQIFLTAMIQQHISDLFPGMKATGCYAFRVTLQPRKKVKRNICRFEYCTLLQL